MNSAQPMRSTSVGPARAAFERRLRAAWIDYLRTTQDAAHREYEAVEAEAWERLQRRLRRNQELLTLGR